ncbi:MAG: hypothetical protein AB7I18_11825 [Candidatus Berkiella sp.]
MSFIKLGETLEILGVENTESCLPAVSPEILDSFRKTANNLKKVAPKAEDFLYFSAVMMHAAEAAAYNDDGTPKLTRTGEPVKVSWDKSGGTWRWQSNDPGIKPYKNSNGDIFPEEELVRAYKKWVGKPLCIDHKSSSVDHVRGFIVDTYYDRSLKRVIALCALDKAGYPQLARQVATGVSNCVSMGTAVGRAICSDCARVAKAEADFCDHMRRKSCYGEINVDLNPIELSIVVNGADPKANIKTIIAAHNALNGYLETKQQEIAKFADNFRANIQFTKGNPNTYDPNGSGAVTNVEVTSKDLETFKKDVDNAIADFQKLQSSLNEENMQGHGNDLASDQSLSESSSANDFGLAPPQERYASTDYTEVGAEAIEELRKVTAAIEDKLSYMKDSLDKLTKTSINKQEENMSGSKEINKQGYFQGAGGVNEPTPGQAKYPKDPLNEQLRDSEDRQMVGQAPFPGVGPVDGVHPSPDSADQSNELERKKMLARAEAEERMRNRSAIVNLAKAALEDKKAYWQGGGGVNEPTPGKPKYPKDKGHMAYEDDKHMHGQKPFPGVGPVDGMHPSPASADTSDEKKRKEMLSRASLRARFTKAANADGSQNLGASSWDVYYGDKLVLTASVDELSGGRAKDYYYNIATREFGAKLIDKIKTYGADSVRALVKQAQGADPAAAGAAPPPPAPPADAGAPPADMGAPEMSEDTGKSGDPKATAGDLAEKVRDLSSDLVEAVRALTGEQAEMGEGEEAAPPAGGEMGATASLNDLRKNLNGALIHAMKEAIAELKDHQQELEMISGIYDRGAVNDANGEFVGSIVEDALNEAKTSLADGFKLMTAFVKYARGTKAIVKRAEIEAELEALAEGDSEMSTKEETDSHSGDDLMSLVQETNADLDAVEDLLNNDELSEDLDPDMEGLELGDEEVTMPSDDADADITAQPGELGKLKVNPGDHVTVASLAGLETLESRAAMRAKLAADALGKEDDGEVQDMSHAKFSDMLDEADRLADGQTKLDVKPTGDLGYIETLPEVNKAMMELAKAPPKVRKEAEAIHNLVSQGKLDPSDLDALVAEGLDPAAVAYYKKYFGQTDGGSEFASELVKEHVKAQLEEELNKYRVKLARAYELAYDMADRGLCHFERVAISAQVDEIMKFNDDSFESLKKVVARHAPLMRKEAGRLPQVGVIGSGEINASPSAEDDYALLSAAFSKTSKRLF